MHRLIVRVHTGASERAVEKIDDTTYRVSVTEQPEHGKANHAVIQMLAAHFHVPQSHIIIKVGHTSRSKIIEVW